MTNCSSAGAKFVITIVNDDDFATENFLRTRIIVNSTTKFYFHSRHLELSSSSSMTDSSVSSVTEGWSTAPTTSY